MGSREKAKTFIGFVLKTKRYKIGLNAVGTLKRANLMIVCKTASDNTKKESIKFATKFNCPLLMTETDELAELTMKENAKIMAVTDKDLSKAIYNEKETVFKEVCLGE